MIVIRNVFRLKFGKAREAVPLFEEGLAIQKKVARGRPRRINRVGDLILENDGKDLR